MISEEAKPVAERRPWPRPARLDFLVGMGAAPASVAFAVGLSHLLELWLRLPNLAMVFLIPVIFCAVKFGLWSAITASALSFLADDFFFVDPRYEFTISEPQEFLSLIVFLAVAAITAMLASRVRAQSKSSFARAQAAQSLFEFSRKISGAASLDDVLWAAAVHARKTFDARCVVLLMPEDGELRIHAAWPPVDKLEVGEASAAHWALENRSRPGGAPALCPMCGFSFGL